MLTRYSLRLALSKPFQLGRSPFFQKFRELSTSSTSESNDTLIKAKQEAEEASRKFDEKKKALEQAEASEPKLSSRFFFFS